MQFDDIEFRPAAAADTARLAEFARASFAETYSPSHDADRVRAHCATVLADDRIDRAIASESFLLATLAGRIVGFAQWHPARLPALTDRDLVALHPIELRRFYVEAAAKGRGLAQQLFTQVLTRAVTAGGDVLWLGVYPGNDRARRFYARCGFIEVGVVPYTFVDLTENDLALALPLTPATR